MSVPAPTTVVLKFGGTSVGSPERIRAVARTVAQYRTQHEKVVVVVSAMGQSTDELISLALSVSPRAQDIGNRREMDMLLSTGERISMALLSLALADLSVKAVSFTGSQSGIITSTAHGEALISQIKPIRIAESLDRGHVVIVAGFQGVSEAKEITTLGRGGSDTSAVALGAALEAEKTVIFTDVDGLYSGDPRKVTSARLHARVGWDTALLAAHFGAQVLHPRCVEVAWKHGLGIELRSSFKEGPGTWIEGVDMNSLEGSKVFSIACQRGLVRYRVKAKEPAALLKLLRDRGLKVLGWNSFEGGTSLFLEEEQDLSAAVGAAVESRTRCARLAVVGVGLLNSPEPNVMFHELCEKSGLPTLESEVHPTFLSAVVTDDADKLDGLVKSLHSAFIS